MNETQQKRLAFRNTIGSAESGTVSVLALVETILASSIYIFLAIKFGTLHLAISCTIAPLLLLRTERSTELGIRLGRKWVRRIHTQSPSSDSVILGFVEVGIACLVARVCATVVTVTKHPIHSITAIPSNWWNFVAKLDVCVPPEALPGIESLPAPDTPADFMNVTEPDPDFKYDEFFNIRLSQIGSTKHGIVNAVLGLVIMFPVTLPAICYRWSMKGTAVLLSPLVWVAHDATSTDMRTVLRDIKELAISRASRIYSLIVLLLFAGELTLHFVSFDLSSRIDNDELRKAFEAYILPSELARWHIVGAANAVLAWALYFFADWILSRASRERFLDTAFIPNALRLLQSFRGLCTVYTVFCGVYVAASLAKELRFPALGSKWFPWS